MLMGSEWSAAERKREEADGAARRARTSVPPELWPAIVTLEGLPPNDGAARLMNSRAFTESFTARLVFPLGARNPSYRYT